MRVRGTPSPLFNIYTNKLNTMDVLLNGLSISARGELQSLCCMMGKTMSLFGC